MPAKRPEKQLDIWGGGLSDNIFVLRAGGGTERLVGDGNSGCHTPVTPVCVNMMNGGMNRYFLGVACRGSRTLPSGSFFLLLVRGG